MVLLNLEKGGELGKAWTFWTRQKRALLVDNILTSLKKKQLLQDLLWRNYADEHQLQQLVYAKF
ncbi:hypothetical protein Anas_00558, partial [Armadillidium nasatum]